MYVYILLALVASAAANVVLNSGCPDIQAVDNFNIDEYGSGIWYEVARYPNEGEKGGECGSSDYKLKDGAITVKNSYVAKNKLRSISGTVELAEDAGTTGKLLYTYPYGPSGASYKSYFWILDIKYDQYAIGYLCRYNEKKKAPAELAWVFSRTKTLEGDAKTAVDKILKESTLIDSSKIVWPSFSEEACRVDA